ncbi:Beta-glucuronosyltransferase GlcAT14B [Porphyridium purpureum]|uniref:protein xylosyltransferase n=1 Tax=Porphyridium purpureum TaxID=35688 RepID=A0A5J4YWT0_PORPP|nr:Beta-glucuronosyltransferase GlcAT14B [Porphyridium purpureum]|eukprot:POR3489..scf209_3
MRTTDGPLSVLVAPCVQSLQYSARSLVLDIGFQHTEAAARMLSRAGRQHGADVEAMTEPVFRGILPVSKRELPGLRALNHARSRVPPQLLNPVRLCYLVVGICLGIAVGRWTSKRVSTSQTSATNPFAALHTDASTSLYYDLLEPGDGSLLVEKIKGRLRRPSDDHDYAEDSRKGKNVLQVHEQSFVDVSDVIDYENFDPGFASTEERSVPSPPQEIVDGIAFFIQLSAKNMEQLPRLLSALYHEHNAFVIHFDRRVPQAAYELVIFASCKMLESKLKPGEKTRRESKCALPSNVLYLSRDYVTWGGVSIVLNVIRGMEWLLNHRAFIDGPKKIMWSHLIYLSASAYPLVSPTDMHALLHRPEMKTTSFVHMESLESYTRKGDTNVRGRLGMFRMDPGVFGMPVPRTKDLCGSKSAGGFSDVTRLPTDQFYKGEFWSVLSRSAVSTIVHSTEAKTWLIRLSTFFVPDELFVQTVISQHQHLLDKARGDPLLYLCWTREMKEDGSVRVNAHPNVLTRDHSFAKLRESGALLARKFDARSEHLMDRIEKELHNNEEYLKRVAMRMSSACRLKEQACRETPINGSDCGVVK